MKLKELFEAERIKILFEGKAKDSHMSVLVPWIQADKKNLNDRIYPKALLQRETARIQKAVESGAFIGTGDHPASGMTDIATASHIVRKIWLDEDGQGQAEIKILPTARGKNIMALIKGGASLGISARGFGNIDEKTRRVKDDYKLQGIDIVTSPSFKDATFDASNVFESIDFEPENKKKGFSQEELDEHMKHLFDGDTAFRGTLEEWINQKGLPVYAKNLVEQGAFASVEEALEYLKPRQKVKPKDVLIEAHIAGISAKVYAERVNATIDQEVAVAKRDFSPEQRMAILKEASAAGMVGETRLVEKIGKYPDGEKRIYYESQKVDVCDSEVRAKILETAKKQKDGTIQKPEPLSESEKKGLLSAEKSLAGFGTSLREPKKNKE